MDKFWWYFFPIMTILVTLGYMAETAEAHMIKDGLAGDNNLFHIFELLTSMFQEEQKQTALLEQQNCFILYKDGDDYNSWDDEHSTIDDPEELLERCPLYPIVDAIREATPLTIDNSTLVPPKQPVTVNKTDGHR